MKYLGTAYFVIFEIFGNCTFCDTDSSQYFGDFAQQRTIWLSAISLFLRFWWIISTESFAKLRPHPIAIYWRCFLSAPLSQYWLDCFNHNNSCAKLSLFLSKSSFSRVKQMVRVDTKFDSLLQFSIISDKQRKNKKKEKVLSPEASCTLEGLRC